MTASGCACPRSRCQRVARSVLNWRVRRAWSVGFTIGCHSLSEYGSLFIRIMTLQSLLRMIPSLCQKIVVYPSWHKRSTDTKLPVRSVEYRTSFRSKDPKLTHPCCVDEIDPPFEATAMLDGLVDLIDENANFSPNIWLEAPVSMTVGSLVTMAEKAVL